MKRKIPNYEDKVLDKDKMIRLKRLEWQRAKGIIKKTQGGKKQNGE